MFDEPISQWLTGPAIAIGWLVLTTSLMLLSSIGLVGFAFL